MITLHINGERRRADADDATPLLWVLRDTLHMTGTKYGCGIGACGACTVLLDGEAIRSCATPVTAAAAGKRIATIEGAARDRVGQVVQQAWQALNVVQCGYCQSGQIMSATALLARNPAPSDADIDVAMGGNVCRCATYVRIRAAIHFAAGKLA